MTDELLRVENLRVGFAGDAGSVVAVDGVSFALKRQETLGIVGESGCGKSVTAMSLLRLIPKPTGKIISGSITYGDVDLLSMPAEHLYKIRGDRISMIFQEPMSALNPVLRVGEQIAESLRTHKPEMSTAQIKQKTTQLFKDVGIPAPASRIDDFPHQLSGGMRQRVMIALALACEPDVLIADEPTTALDVTIQAQILTLLKAMQQRLRMAIILITHDLAVVSEMCDRVIVMYGGQIVEQAPTQQLLLRPLHPYTRGLLSSIPSDIIPPKSLLKTIEGHVPPLHAMPKGCRFSNRCPHAVWACNEHRVNLEPVDATHQVACIRWKELEHAAPT